MKNQKILLIISLVITISLVVLITSNLFISNNKNNNPESIIDNLYKAIEQAKKDGNYKCCIEPACTMCYLGKWKYEKGTCFCDDEILKGNFDDVCPECKNNIKEGQCKNSTNNLNEEFCAEI